jgi:RND family efflux transporter MFP subunit
MYRYILTLTTLLILAGCGKQEPRKTEAAAAGAPVAVQAAAARQVEWPSGYEAVGTVRARTTSAVSAKVMGYVREVRVQVGDRVKEGQVLVVLDSRDLETACRQAEAMRLEVTNAIPEADNAIAAAKANLELAQVTYNRMKDLLDKKSVSNQEYDEAATRLKGAQAALEMAQSRRAQLNAKAAQAQEGIRSAEITRGFAQIAAPFSGVITARTVEPGVLATPGAPMFTIEREGAWRLEAPVDESHLGSVRAGQTVTVELEALNRTLQARVSEIVPAVDAASRAYTVKIDLPSVPQMRSGIFGRAVFPLGTRKVLVIPAAAVIERGQLQSVFVAEDGFARTRLITTGRKHQDHVEVLSGLNPGDKVICPQPPGLSEGAKVEVRL